MGIDKIKNLIKIGRKTENIDNKRIKVDYLDTIKTIRMVSPYGIQSNPADNTYIIMFNIEGNEDNIVGIPVELNNIDENINSDELLIGIPASEAKIKFRDDNTIAIILGNVENGDFLARFNELKAGFDQLKSDFNNHVSNWNTFASAYVPGGPAIQGLPPTATSSASSTASIDDAKIDEITVP